MPAGDKGLEIAPGKDVDENEELNVVGNAYNAVPVAKQWIPVDPRPGCITVCLRPAMWSDAAKASEITHLGCMTAGASCKLLGGAARLPSALLNMI